MKYNIDENGYYGPFGGAYIPEILYANVENLRKNYLKVMADPSFQKELDDLLRDYVGRPSPLYYAKRLSEKYGTRVYLKREDLNHTVPIKSTILWGRFCWPVAWARNGSSPKPEPDSTVWPQPPYAP